MEITENIQLTAIECYDGKTHFKKCSIEYAKEFRKAGFYSLDGSIITWSNIKTIRNATSFEFFENCIFPKIQQSEKDIFIQIRSNISQNNEKNIKLQQILCAMRRKKEEKEYYSLKKISDSEKERRKKQVEKMSQRLRFLSII